ncbi:MAG: DUF2339 domain-containing protein [Lachnospiraceae bacterium]|nr:DUF2339 domain-containing protein [Lachnospiraceae bacterium]
MNQQEEILQRLSRIEEMLSQGSEKSVDPIQQMRKCIVEEMDQVDDQDYIRYLKKMDDELRKESLRISDMRANLATNRKRYENNRMRRAGIKPETVSDKPETVLQPTQIPGVFFPGDTTGGEEEPVKPAEQLLTAEPEAAAATGEKPLEGPAAPVPAAENGQAGRIDPAFMPEPVASPRPEVQSAEVQSSSQNAKPGKEKHSIEYNFGGILLSVVGAVFLILSMVFFGKTYMDSLSQGLALYILGAVIFLFSEIVLVKHLESFSKVISGVGIGVLFTATILNYLYLKTMNGVAALIITLVISVFTLVFSRKKDSGFLRIIGILGCYISFAPLQSFEAKNDFLIPVIMLFIVNVLYLLLPPKKGRQAVLIVHSIANVLMVIAFSVMLSLSGKDIREEVWIPLAVFVAGFLVINALICRGEATLKNILSTCCEVLIAFVLLLLFAESDHRVPVSVLLCICLAVCFWIDRKLTKMRWIHLYIGSAVVAGMMIGEGEKWFLVTVAAILCCYKLLCRKEELAIANLVVSVIAALVFVRYVKDPSNMQFLILGIMVVSVFFVKFHKTAMELILLVMLEAFAVFGFDQLEISVSLGLIFVLLHLFLLRVFDYLQDEHLRVFTVTSAVFSLVFALTAMGVEKMKYLSLTIVLLSGIAILFLLFGKTFRLMGEGSEKARNMAVAIFLTYMILIYRIEKPVITSILLMLLAISGVGTGFFIKQKPLRLYGLFLALFVCAKLVVFDFSDTQASDKVILFAVVGLLAIGISYLYLRLEKQTEVSQ